jgi:hypothetical protein
MMGKTMAAIFGIALVYLFLQVLLLGFAVAIGFLLRCCFSDVSMGQGVLIGMLSTIASAYILMQFARAASAVGWNNGYVDEDDDDCDDEDGDFDDGNDDDDDDGPDDTLPDTRNSLPLTPQERRQRAGKRR